MNNPDVGEHISSNALDWRRHGMSNWHWLVACLCFLCNNN